MNFKRVMLGLLGFVCVSSITLADDSKLNPMLKYLAKMAIYDTEDGRKVETFEDVYLKLDPLQERNEPHPFVNLFTIPEGYVDVKTAKEYFKKFSKQAIVSQEDDDFEEFMNNHFYMKTSLDEEAETINDFPHDYFVSDVTNKGKLYLCMDHATYFYVISFKKFEPDAVSCKVCPSLCGEKCSSGHVYGPKNVYSDFKNKLLEHTKMISADRIEQEDLYVEYKTKDRTPPFTNLEYLDLGGDPGIYACTSGDWYRTDDFESYKDMRGGFNPVYHFLIRDNDASETSARFAFGRFNNCPSDGERLEDIENWTNPENIKDQTAEDPRFFDIVKFDPSLDGIIRYAIISKEKSQTGNVNPGIEKVKQDRPEVSYGFSETKDLGNTPKDAKDWFEKDDLERFAERGKNTGNLRIFDNDRPNICIRITNELTGEQMFFPPCVASAEYRITNSSKYKALSGLGKKNQDDYLDFVKNIGPDYDHAVLFESTGLTPYFTIYSLGDKSIKTETETGYSNKLINNKDVDFINQNVRLEDYYFSDKEKDGSATYVSKKGSFGKRRGTLANMVALYENNSAFVFRTGVEYRLDVWTDDNTKWTNIEYEKDLNGQPAIQRVRDKKTGQEEYSIKPTLLENAKVFDTGIKKGVIEVYVPGNSEFDHGLFDIDNKKHINGDLHFVLKDATVDKYNFEKVEELDENNFPYIAVKVEDFSGLTRELKLYLRVNDRNIDVKVLEGSKSDRK